MGCPCLGGTGPTEHHVRSAGSSHRRPTGGLGAWLEPIQSYCIINELPPLTVLVVQQESGMPGSGFTGASAGELAQAQAKVFSYNWLEHGNPGAEKLELAAKQLPSNGTRSEA